MSSFLKKIFPLRREDVEQPAFADAQCSVQHGGRDVGRVAGLQSGLLSLDGEFEFAGQAVANLFMDMPVLLADCSRGEHDLNSHHAAAVGLDLAGNAAFLDGFERDVGVVKKSSTHHSAYPKVMQFQKALHFDRACRVGAERSAGGAV